MEFNVFGRNKYKYWMGTADGVNYVFTDDIDELPEGCTPAPLNAPMTSKQRRVLESSGCTVREVYLHG